MNLPPRCGEYGGYNKYGDVDSRCRYIRREGLALKTLTIPGCYGIIMATFLFLTARQVLITYRRV